MLLTLYDSWFKEDVSIYSYFMKCVFAVVGSIAGIGYVAGSEFSAHQGCGDVCQVDNVSLFLQNIS